MKKTAYILLCMVLATMLSFIAHVLVVPRFIPPAACAYVWLGGSLCLLPGWAQYSVLFTGVVGGFFLGQTWWRIVYIERRHWRMKR